MLTKRIIPCLDVDQGRVVKGIKFKNIKDAGDPTELAVFYNKEGADELVFLDITASHEKRKTIVDVVKKMEEIISNYPDNPKKSTSTKFSEEEQKIAKELKKLGYM